MEVVEDLGQKFKIVSKTPTRQGCLGQKTRLEFALSQPCLKRSRYFLPMAAFTFSKLAIPGVSLLVIFLAYSSQVLFLHIEPTPLSKRELIQFNLLIFCLWICYLRACITSPGSVPQDWIPMNAVNGEASTRDAHDGHSRQRWCRKCEAFKPPRTHHCKTCGRLVITQPKKHLPGN
jgi:ribosomal protein L40E